MCIDSILIFCYLAHAITKLFFCNQKGCDFKMCSLHPEITAFSILLYSYSFFPSIIDTPLLPAAAATNIQTNHFTG